MVGSRKNISQWSDLELLDGYRRENNQAFVGELYNRYRHLVFGVCLKYLKSREDAKDAAISLFEKLIVELRGRDIRAFAPWLHTVTRNHCLMILRAASRAPVEIEITERVSESDEIEAPSLEERLQQMEKAVLELEENQQVCVSLFYLKEKSYREISRSTGFTEAQVKSYIQNGRRNLRNILLRRA